MNKIFWSALIVLAGLGVRGAHADVINVVGVNDSSLTATVIFSYAAIDDFSGAVSISVENTTATTGTVTGLGFNIDQIIDAYGVHTLPGDPTSPWSVIPSDSGGITFDTISSPQQYGFFDVAAVTGSNGLNGGSPGDGIAKGATGLFSIGFTNVAGGMNALTTSSFLSLLSQPAPQGNASFTAVNFIVRFQETGSDGEDSDVAVAVPETGTFALLGLAAGAGYIIRRRRRS
jgi:hypothetical protein